MTIQNRSAWSFDRLAAIAWISAGTVYLVSEAVSAFAFSPRYSYAGNYISDLGVTVCGTTFDNRPICSPLHALMNAGFAVQGLAFLGAALAIRQATAGARSTLFFVVVAASNGIGNLLLGLFPENAPGRLGEGFSYHVLGALLAILCGNAAGLISAWTLAELRLARVHRWASIGLPILAAVAFTMLILARGSGIAIYFPDGVWERISVYTIIVWELLSGLCVLGRLRRPASAISP